MSAFPDQDQVMRALLRVRVEAFASSQRTHSVMMIFGPRMAPHSQAFSQMRHVLHSDQRLIRNTVRVGHDAEKRAQAGRETGSKAFRTNIVAMRQRTQTSSGARVSGDDSPNIQNGSTLRIDQRKSLVIRK
jgi:hypothetical protein